MKTGIELIAEERQRQIEVEGWTAEHDKEQAIGELALAASCYAMIPELRPSELPPSHWPWVNYWKPSPNDRIRELQKAGALIAAEIDRLQEFLKEERAEIKQNIGKCDCEDHENGMVSNCCPVHNYNPYPKSILDE